MSSTMKKSVLVALGVVVILFFVVTFTRGHEDHNAGDTSNGVYYTGPMPSKSDPTKWIDYQGHIVPPPPGAKTSAPVAKSGGAGE